jgi:site-specific recombinase XerC
MRRERRGHPPRASWATATATYLLVTDFKRSTRESYRGQLNRAGELLGKVELGQLKAEDLEAYRAAVMGSRRGTKSQALTAARVFLVWAAEHALVGLAPTAMIGARGAACGAVVIKRDMSFFCLLVQLYM